MSKCGVTIQKLFDPTTGKTTTRVCPECPEPGMSRCKLHIDRDPSKARAAVEQMMAVKPKSVKELIDIKYSLSNLPFVELSDPAQLYWVKLAGTSLELVAHYPAFASKRWNWQFDTIGSLEADMLSVLAAMHQKQQDTDGLYAHLAPLRDFIKGPEQNLMHPLLQQFIQGEFRGKPLPPPFFKYLPPGTAAQQAYLLQLMPWCVSLQDGKASNAAYASKFANIGPMEQEILGAVCRLQMDSSLASDQDRAAFLQGLGRHVALLNPTFMPSMDPTLMGTLRAYEGLTPRPPQRQSTGSYPRPIRF